MSRVDKLGNTPDTIDIENNKNVLGLSAKNNTLVTYL